MRTLPALALVLAACGCSDRPATPAAHDAPSPSASRGPDPIVLRIPRDGGIARAVAYPRLDSVLWESPEPAPAPAHVLGFDADLGTMALVDSKGRPGRIDFRGEDQVVTLTRGVPAALASADGSTIFGIVARDTIVRYTPTGVWRYKPPRRPRAILPQPDGSLLVLADDGDSTRIWHMHPPETRLVDTAALPRAGRPVRTQVGDRVYMTVDSGLIGVRTRDLTLVPSVPLAGTIAALVPTPSGDRLYIARDSSRELAVFDRYGERIEAEIELPGVPRELRMDPLGRFLLVRQSGADSVWVIAISTNRLLGAVPTAWRADLPTVAPDGAILLATGKDVRLVDGETLRPLRTVPGGANDFWHFFLWNGFRARAAGLDEPVSFADRVPVDTTPTDSLRADSLPADSLAPRSDVASADSPLEPPPRPAPPADPARDSARTTPVGYVVQLAALLSERAARDLAGEVNVDGRAARVQPSTSSGTVIYRVVLGPYSSRVDAERAGRATGRSYWVYEGTP